MLEKVHAPTEVADPLNPYVWPQHGLTLVVLSRGGRLKGGRVFRTGRPAQAKLFCQWLRGLSRGNIVVLLAAVGIVRLFKLWPLKVEICLYF